MAITSISLAQTATLKRRTKTDSVQNKDTRGKLVTLYRKKDQQPKAKGCFSCVFSRSTVAGCSMDYGCADDSRETIRLIRASQTSISNL